MRIRVGFILNRHKNEGAFSEYYHGYRELEHTGVRDHNEIPRRQSRRSSTASVGERQDEKRRGKKK
jgi:uncharacterized protein (DUF433 family)